MFTLVARRASSTLAARAALVRSYTSSVKEGSVAQSKGFSKKEKAHEDEYARRHEADLLRKLKAEIEAKKQEVNTKLHLQAELESKMKESK
ncbi:hypothetical protein HYDPIDRAFT_31519 [Hydnomerulius pinastri MD-312]|uniref:ATPase inhibitor, mitochondrial n=1 Tax=Hydnomerulius pinastri MD-312 TaxID=994086 RepID=A0A0C9VTF1_9AGAM|nr:hypothetical protein HYDPIDRAFT_31519 [Hydnomerulius pinastri MD-312]